jgi:type I restriction enzyme R subunit
MAYLSEADVEAMLLEQLEGLGYARLTDAVAGPDGAAPEREAYSDTVLLERLRQAVDRLNPHIPPDARHDAIKKVLAAEIPSPVEENRRLHQAIVEGITVEFYAEDGGIRGDKVRLVDFDDPGANDWLAVAQFTVVENRMKRRPDVVIFVNGLPLAVIEIKNPGAEAVPDQCGAGDDGRAARPDRLADGERRTLHALAHDGRAGRRAQGQPGNERAD